MIFVTVGTHEQQFNRLVKFMDAWSISHDEEVVIQSGFSSYEPKNCKWSKLYDYDDMINFVSKARIIITHGGPATFILPLMYRKIPIVVPRRKEFGEHINNHQVEFCSQVYNRKQNIILVESIDKLGNVLEHYDKLVSNMSKSFTSNNNKFCNMFSNIVNDLI